MMKVQQQTIDKARFEIREDENRRQQSLKQFRDWISKHPFIKRCAKDDKDLLPFLRAKKYQMDTAFDAFEKVLIFIKTHEDWFDFSEKKLQKCYDLYRSGFLRVTKERDSQGRRTIFINHNIDMESFNGDDIFRLHCLIAPILSNEEESQLFGVNYVADFTGEVTMKHLTVCPLKSLYEFVSQIQVTPLRYKNICIIGLPNFASQFLHMIKMGLSDTMMNRLHVLNDVNDLWTFVEQSSMTEKYGGKFTDEETMEAIWKIVQDKINDFKNFLDFEIDLTRAKEMKNLKNESIGSFRKLEID